jgi:hypothetical protein
MRTRRDVSHMIGHPYFAGSEIRDERGTGLSTALEEMAENRAKSDRLRAAREAAANADR